MPSPTSAGTQASAAAQASAGTQDAAAAQASAGTQDAAAAQASAGTRVSAGARARRTHADRSAATRDALVTAARGLFAAQGFAEVPTDAIVAAAGVTRGALYHQFADKTALFDAVVDAVEADIAQRLAQQVAAAGIADPVEAMHYAVRAWLAICVEPEIHRIALIDGPS